MSTSPEPDGMRGVSDFMKRLAVTLAAAALLTSACSMVRGHSDDTSTIEHKGGVDRGRELANRACHRSGKEAEVISTVNKNPEAPPETGKQVTTVRCR
jgi:predicted small secreted protein